ncbi:MAG: hypothetical protein LBT20_00685 [Clostridiales bacterium]|jgi:hypothetical protein|nr:hypothetical protein [Clostridiales bacterium]
MATKKCVYCQNECDLAEAVCPQCGASNFTETPTETPTRLGFSGGGNSTFGETPTRLSFSGGGSPASDTVSREAALLRAKSKRNIRVIIGVVIVAVVIVAVIVVSNLLPDYDFGVKGGISDTLQTQDFDMTVTDFKIYDPNKDGEYYPDAENYPYVSYTAGSGDVLYIVTLKLHNGTGFDYPLNYVWDFYLWDGKIAYAVGNIEFAVDSDDYYYIVNDDPYYSEDFLLAPYETRTKTLVFKAPKKAKCYFGYDEYDGYNFVQSYGIKLY